MNLSKLTQLVLAVLILSFQLPLFFGLGPSSTDAAIPFTPTSDFNGDGFADLAIGAPFETIGTGSTGVQFAGAVSVFYGSANRLGGSTTIADQFWHQNTAGILDSAEGQDHFGTALASGDFNGDGFSDLAIGVADEDVGTINGAGAVNVIYGSSTGLKSAGNQLWTQNSAGILDTAETGDAFGARLAAGDFNGDGRADLAINSQFEKIGTVNNAGAVNVIYGSSSGLASTGNQFWHQDSPNILEVVEEGDFFGRVGTGYFNGDGFADLAIGVLGESINVSGNNIVGGAVNVIYGSSTGLKSAGNQLWTQNSPGILDAAENNDEFGFSVAGGDFNSDGNDDLAVGVFREDIPGVSSGDNDAGAVNVIYGSSTGLKSAGNQLWTQNSAGIKDASEVADLFGYSLNSNDFDGDGHADLAIGSREWIESANPLAFEGGAVNVIYGSSSGLASAGNQVWNQQSPGIEDNSEDDDFFGQSLASGDFDNNGFADLAIGVIGEDIEGRPSGTLFNAGAVHALYSFTATGLSSTSDQFLLQDSGAVPSVPDSLSENFDSLGSSSSGATSGAESS